MNQTNNNNYNALIYSFITHHTYVYVGTLFVNFRVQKN